ncbi:efflux RND transporter periplasmic adaptor subunit [Rhizobium hidalgonense]|uniref:Efflux RND transporter periplasmic adaptor subunit n=1 Tax=Rhizobium hidalgonense TaxID=1538159 RepID=A0A2A6KDL5_9HYPH|nr:efflux RND transporter periplasmic adaptor subunit [Rhizobium hidalgonense]MDR9773303.1 efflux RND transporter periplasmic adaptor subunit [Rhizobium hidalgonense]MDR9802992.1 efflux RND transporter periplasmic adaptor subunit [Rhizobium hidalgonense]MDR9810401.1 efflux RND transporter periplasmic adaptor subunit [Rhizobium hidalgonense]MDR9819028.1 efflux RND transporter periplasmic adaptor subunit [Rhizobium hidalgonense]PDT22783.1 efflux transporter periplasmic adaptor subunit [Rhizobium
MSIRPKIIALMMGTALIASCTKQEESTGEAPRPVLSITVRQTPATSLGLTGTIQPTIETDLGFRILGRMIARNVNVGDVVKKGDVVAAIDPLALELAVRSAQSDVENSDAQLRNAVTTEQRQRALVESRSGTEASLEEAEQAKRTAAATVAKAQANLDKAREQLGYAQLQAEFDGVVTASSAEVGQVVSAGQTVVTIARPDKRDAVVDVPQAAAQKLKVGAPFEVTLQLEPSIRTTGVVREIAPEAEAATRTSRTKIALADPPAAFRLGAVITASAAIAADPEIVLPSSAILAGTNGASVWIVDVPAKKVALRRVKIDGDVVDGGTVRVTEGLAPGERVVVAGVHKLEDGQAIRIDQEISQ